jgi:hypothetical protein
MAVPDEWGFLCRSSLSIAGSLVSLSFSVFNCCHSMLRPVNTRQVDSC